MFLNNESTKEYFNIISKYKGLNKKDLDGYCEKHHILPSALGGSNKKDNIVYLPASDHFKCHQLLTQITENTDNSKMWSALWRMMNKQSKTQKRTYDICSIEYETARQKHAEAHSIRQTGKNNSFFGKKHSDETRKKMSNAKKGKSYSEIYGEEEGKIMKERRRVETTGKKRSGETKEKIRQSKIGKKRDPELMKRIGDKLRGRKRSAEIINKTKETIRINSICCEHCGKTVSKGNHTRWHGSKCSYASDVEMV